MTLTEQWKKGELDGEYYIKTTNGEIYIVEFQNSISVKRKKLSNVKSFKGYIYKKTVKEVLAPVPSYEEYLESESHCSVYSDVNKSLKEENQQLKKLLKECRYNVATDLEDAIMCESNVDIEYFEYLLTRIDNAIGENNALSYREH